MTERRKFPLQLLTGLVFLLITSSASAQTTPLNMKEAIDIAFSNNYSLRADSLNMIIAAFKNKETARMV